MTGPRTPIACGALARYQYLGHLAHAARCYRRQRRQHDFDAPPCATVSIDARSGQRTFELPRTL
jgi:hypothetical protein